ncbi:hypothetical protein TTRE_0000944901, partial [Trichuris trichiura]
MTSTTQRNPTSDPERTAGGDGADFVAARYPGPFRCPLCAAVNAVAHTFLEHMRRHAREVRFQCAKCSRLWPTIHSVACHYSKCGRQVTRSVPQPPLAVEDRPHTVVCTDCGEHFTTAVGLQLHRRNAHPEQFNADRPREKKARWSQFEVQALATLEAKLPPNITNVNQVLARQLFEKHGSTRNVEMVKGQRKKSRYKEIVLALKSANGNTDNISNEPGRLLESGSASGFQSAVPAQTNVLPDGRHVMPNASAFPASDGILPPVHGLVLDQPTASTCRRVPPGESTIPTPADVLLLRQPILPAQTASSSTVHVLPDESTVPTSDILSVPRSVLPTKPNILPDATAQGVDDGGQQANHADPETNLRELVIAALRDASCREAPEGTLLKELSVLAGLALEGRCILNDTADA